MIVEITLNVFYQLIFKDNFKYP